MAKFLDLTGQRFGRLTIINYAGRKYNTSMWLCSCDCGRVLVAASNHLRSGATRSCGCLRGEILSQLSLDRSLPRGVAARRSALSKIKRSAVQRDYEWQLDDDYALDLMQQDCFYCGSKPERVVQSGKMTGKFVCNSLDRVDNSKGYIVGNVVPCCKHCNIAKGTRSVNEFLAWVDRVHQHSVELEDE